MKVDAGHDSFVKIHLQSWGWLCGVNNIGRLAVFTVVGVRCTADASPPAIEKQLVGCCDIFLQLRRSTTCSAGHVVAYSVSYCPTDTDSGPVASLFVVFSKWRILVLWSIPYGCLHRFFLISSWCLMDFQNLFRFLRSFVLISACCISGLAVTCLVTCLIVTAHIAYRPAQNIITFWLFCFTYLLTGKAKLLVILRTYRYWFVCCWAVLDGIWFSWRT